MKRDDALLCFAYVGCHSRSVGEEPEIDNGQCDADARPEPRRLFECKLLGLEGWFLGPCDVNQQNHRGTKNIPCSPILAKKFARAFNASEISGSPSIFSASASSSSSFLGSSSFAAPTSARSVLYSAIYFMQRLRIFSVGPFLCANDQSDPNVCI